MKISFSSVVPQLKEIAIVGWKKQKGSGVFILPSGQKSIVLGIEDLDGLNRRRLILLSRQIITLAKANRIKKIAFKFEDFSFSKLKISKEEMAELLAASF